MTVTVWKWRQHNDTLFCYFAKRPARFTLVCFFYSFISSYKKSILSSQYQSPYELKDVNENEPSQSIFPGLSQWQMYNHLWSFWLSRSVPIVETTTVQFVSYLLPNYVNTFIKTRHGEVQPEWQHLGKQLGQPGCERSQHFILVKDWPPCPDISFLKPSALVVSLESKA